MRVYASRLKVGQRLSTSLWFVPATMVLASALLAAAMVALDARVVGDVRRLPELLELDASSARMVLSVVAGSMIGTMGTVLAMTVITLSLASQQFTPRTLTTFTSDRGTQVVIGTFTGAFTYCLLVVRTVRDATDQGVAAFVPGIAVAVAIVLGLCGVAALIYFTHNVATSINVATVVARLSTATAPLLDRVFPEGVGRPLEGSAPRDAEHALAWRPVPSHGTGYVQAVDGAGLIALGTTHDLVLRLERGIGDFVAEGDALLSLAAAPGGARAVRGADAELELALNDCIALGGQRTLQQDPEFGLRQVADIAVRTLASGTNDPTTALTCLDYLTTLLRRVAARPDPVPHRADERGALRLVARPATFETVALRTLDHVRQNLGGDAAAIERLLRGLADVARDARDDDRRRTVWEHAGRIASVAGRSLQVAADRRRVNDALRAVAEGARMDGVPDGLLLTPEPPAPATA